MLTHTKTRHWTDHTWTFALACAGAIAIVAVLLLTALELHIQRPMLID